MRMIPASERVTRFEVERVRPFILRKGLANPSGFGPPKIHECSSAERDDYEWIAMGMITDGLLTTTSLGDFVLTKKGIRVARNLSS